MPAPPPPSLPCLPGACSLSGPAVSAPSVCWDVDVEVAAKGADKGAGAAFLDMRPEHKAREAEVGRAGGRRRGVGAACWRHTQSAGRAAARC
jgi:hypothetical protein